MSRSDRRRGGRGRSWSNRGESNEKSERGERGKETRSERKHESRGSASYERRQERRRSMFSQQNSKEIEENQNAIRAFKEQIVTCEICGEAISDIANAISNRGSEKPVHFDCVVNKLSESEKPGMNEKIAYIGQGKFAVIHFENAHDQKHFTIRKTIEWEARDSERGEWRNEMAGLFSQVK